MIKELITTTILSCLLLNSYSQIAPLNKWRGIITNSSFQSLTYYEPESFERFFEENGLFKYNGESITTYRMKVKFMLYSSREGCHIVDILSSFRYSFQVDKEYILKSSNNFSYTNILINLTGKSKVFMNLITAKGVPFVKFINIRKLNEITSCNPKTIYSGATPTKITGTSYPNYTNIKDVINLNIKKIRYRWEMLDENNNWINAPGQYTNKDYLPSKLICINNKETTYSFRRVAHYTQYKALTPTTYSDETAIATIIVKPVTPPTLTYEKEICEDHNSIKIKFSGCLPECSIDEKYNITINDGTRDFIFNNVISDSYISIEYKDKISKTLRMKKISNTSGSQQVIYNSGEEPYIFISKKKNIQTKVIRMKN